MEKQILLIADDVEMNRSVIRRFFQKDFQVLEAANGYQTIEMMEKYKVDLLILDIIMPEMDGMRALRIIREHKEWNHTAILVATSTKEQTERQALEYGADDIVSKPYDPIVIRKRIDNLLDKKRLEQERELEGIAEKELEVEQIVREQWKQRLKGVFARISSFSEIIASNADNPMLVRETADKIWETIEDAKNKLE